MSKVGDTASSFEETVSEMSSMDDVNSEFRKDEAHFRKAFKNFREANSEMQEVFKEFQDFNNRTRKLEAEFRFLGHIQEFLRSDDPSSFFPVIHEREDGPRLNDGWWNHFDYTPTPESMENVNRIGTSIEKLLGSFLEESDDSDYFSDLSSLSTPPGDNSRKDIEETNGGTKWKLKLQDIKQRCRGTAPPAVRLNQLTAARQEYIQEKRCKSAGKAERPIRMPRMDICDNMPQEDMTESLLDAIGPVRLSSDDDLLAPSQDDEPTKLNREEKWRASVSEEEPVKDDSSWISISCRSTPEHPSRICMSDTPTLPKEKEAKIFPRKQMSTFLRLNSAKSSSQRPTPSSTPDSIRHELAGGRFSPMPVHKPKSINSYKSSPALSPKHMVFAPDIDFKKGYLHCPKARKRKGTSREENVVMWNQSRMESILGYP